MIPSIINIKIKSGSRFKLTLWIPLFVLWPIFIVLFILALPFLLLADLIIRIMGIQIKLWYMLSGVFMLFSSLQGTLVKVNSPKSDTIVNVKIS
jgi:hypothetical protein